MKRGLLGKLFFLIIIGVLVVGVAVGFFVANTFEGLGSEAGQAQGPSGSQGYNQEDESPTQETNSGQENEVSSNYFGSYTIDDTGYGTQVTVTVDEAAGTRTIMRNALPNHETGVFPNDGNPNTISEQNYEETYTLEPTFIGSATHTQTIGIAINGVKLEPDTAERVNCESGEEYNVEAKQEVINLGLDFNNAHVQPTGEYHYHGASELLTELYDNGEDLVHVAFAADGYHIYYSKSGAYEPSYKIGSGDREGTDCTYTAGGPGGETVNFGSTKDGSLKQDWDYSASYGDLDECNGIEINGEYIYLMTDDYPFIGRCLMGDAVVSGQGSGGNGPGQGGPGGSGPPQGQGPPPGY